MSLFLWAKMGGGGVNVVDFCGILFSVVFSF